MNVGCLVKHGPGVETVRALLDASKAPTIVVTQRSEAASEWHGELARLCDERAIPLLNVDRLSDPEVAERLREAAPEVMVSVFFTLIVPGEVLTIPPGGIINFHPSLLPAYRGPHPVNWAIIRGESETGLTAHLMVEEVDAGDILRQWRVPIHPEDDLSTVAARIHALIPPAVLEVLELWERGDLRPVPQDESKASYFPRRTEKDDAVIWSGHSVDIHNLIRGLYRPLPGALAFQGDRKIVLRRSRIPDAPHADDDVPPGSILSVESEGMLVRTGTGALLVSEIDVGGEVALTPADAVERGLLDPGTAFHTGGPQ